jgi:hypothetical protein
MEIIKAVVAFAYGPWGDMFVTMWAGAAMVLAFVLGGKEKA